MDSMIELSKAQYSEAEGLRLLEIEVMRNHSVREQFNFPSIKLCFIRSVKYIYLFLWNLQFATVMADLPSIPPRDHGAYMRFALTLAEKSDPKPTNFRVGAILVDEASNQILSTGYTLELPGNTHAEQCCFEKFSTLKGVAADEVGSVMHESTVLYTTMEPCNKRSIGNLPCTERILKTRSAVKGGIKTVYLGVKEPETFVGENEGRAKLEEAGVEYVHVTGFEKEILEVATAGHQP